MASNSTKKKKEEEYYFPIMEALKRLFDRWYVEEPYAYTKDLRLKR